MMIDINKHFGVLNLVLRAEILYMRLAVHLGHLHINGKHLLTISTRWVDPTGSFTNSALTGATKAPVTHLYSAIDRGY